LQYVPLPVHVIGKHYYRTVTFSKDRYYNTLFVTSFHTCGICVRGAMTITTVQQRAFM